MKLLQPITTTILSCGQLSVCSALLHGIGKHWLPRAVQIRSCSGVDAGEWSNFLCITSGSVQDIVPYANELRRGVDAVELRVDMLCDKSPVSVAAQVAALRDLFQLPIIYTVRTRNHLGTYPNEDSRSICQLLQVGVDCNVDWLDVEADLPESMIAEVLEKNTACGGASRIIGSFHTAAVPDKAEMERLFQRCNLHGRADMLKLVTGARNAADCKRIHEVGSSQSKPYIGVCLGEEGAHARVLNRRFTPVTHPRLSPAAPGQLSAKELTQRRIQSGLITPRQYYLFGSPIQHSLSPSMHNGAFDTLLMPHTYSLAENADVGAYPAIMSAADFGGASVTIPHKENIIPLLDEVRGAAAQIGAVNTVVVETAKPAEASHRKRLVGYNTDWIGIRRPVARLLAGKKNQDGKMPGVGLVIGAGGAARAACYAVKDLGLDLVIANVDLEKAKLLAERFGGTHTALNNLRSIDPDDVQVIITTIPAEANFSLPAGLLKSRPVVLDAVYKPARTHLLTQAMAAGCPIIQGATMLLEQGVEQFELWHRRRAPRDVMTRAVFQGVEDISSTLDSQQK